MARILVTGADGFTGRYLAAELATRGHEVHGITRSAVYIEGVSHTYEADLTDQGSVETVVSTVQPEGVVHLAAIAFVASNDIAAMYAVNLVGTRNLLSALRALIRRPRSVVLASSANVYGNATAGAIPETAPFSPANDYAVSKLAMEYCSSLFFADLRIAIARPFNYTGVGQSADFLLPKIVNHVRRGAERIELGNLDVSRDFSDVRDVVAAYAGLLECEGAIGRAVNICSGHVHSLRDLVRIVSSITGIELPVIVNPRLVRPNEVHTLCGDRTLLERLVPDLPRPRPLAETLAWMLQEPLKSESAEPHGLFGSASNT